MLKIHMHLKNKYDVDYIPEKRIRWLAERNERLFTEYPFATLEF